VLQDFSIIS